MVYAVGGDLTVGMSCGAKLGMSLRDRISPNMEAIIEVITSKSLLL
jgi:hypothetical protein